MANGDDAAADGMDIVPPSASRSLGYDEINKTRDYVATRAKKTDLAPVKAAIDNASSNGNTGGGGQIARFSAEGWLGVATPATPSHAVNKAYADNSFAGKTGVPGNFEIGGALSVQDEIIAADQVYAPNADTVSSTYVGLYYQTNNGKVCKGSSSLRYKKNVEDAPPAMFDGVLDLRPVTFDWKSSGYGDTGLIAEEVATTVPWLAVSDADGQPEAVRYEMLGLALLPIVQQLAERVAELEARLDGS